MINRRIMGEALTSNDFIGDFIKIFNTESGGKKMCANLSKESWLPPIWETLIQADAMYRIGNTAIVGLNKDESLAFIIKRPNLGDKKIRQGVWLGMPREPIEWVTEEGYSSRFYSKLRIVFKGPETNQNIRDFDFDSRGEENRTWLVEKKITSWSSWWSKEVIILYSGEAGKETAQAIGALLLENVESKISVEILDSALCERKDFQERAVSFFLVNREEEFSKKFYELFENSFQSSVIGILAMDDSWVEYLEDHDSSRIIDDGADMEEEEYGIFGYDPCQFLILSPLPYQWSRKIKKVSSIACLLRWLLEEK